MTADGLRFELADNFVQGIDVGIASTPVFGDIDRDLTLDLFVGEANGGVNFFRTRARVEIAQDPGSGPSPDVEDEPVTSSEAKGTETSEAASVTVHSVSLSRGGGPTQFQITLGREAAVELQLFDPSGRLVRALDAFPLSAGRHTISWDGRDDHGRAVGPGVFFYRVATRTDAVTGRVVLVR